VQTGLIEATTATETALAPSPLLRAFDSANETTVLPAGATLFARGETPTGIYLVYSGEITLYITGASGRRLPLRNVVAGEFLGLCAAVSGKPHDITAETVTTSEVGFICRSDLLRFLQQQREVSWNLLELLSRDVQVCYDILRIVSDRAPRARA
jgi:CRP-like cAMP-binding protein